MQWLVAGFVSGMAVGFFTIVAIFLGATIVKFQKAQADITNRLKQMNKTS